MGRGPPSSASWLSCRTPARSPSWKSTSGAWDTGKTTLINTAVFLKIMDQVKEDGRYLKYDWSIKADADCVFLPTRIREHIWGLKPQPDQAIYLKNNNEGARGNGGFLGA